jgi:integrase
MGETQRECQAWIHETRIDISHGLTFKGMDIRLDEFLTEWLVMVSSSRTKTTYLHYKWLIETRIIPHIGAKKLDDLKPENIQYFYRFLLKKGSSNHQVYTVHITLRVAFNHAVDLGHIGRNPCKGTTPPKPDHREMKFFNEEQVQTLLEAAVEIDERKYPFYYLAVHTGMRLSELIGLQWKDLDWDQKTISVSRQVQHYKGGGYSFTKPKSKSGIRKVILGDKAVEVLRAQKTELVQRKANAGDDWTELDLIFPSKMGTPLRACNVRRSFKSLLKKAGLPRIRFHDLRHTAASLMLNHGIPVLIASKRLGHSKASITLDIYGHLMPNKQEEAAELLDQLMNLAD